MSLRCLANLLERVPLGLPPRSAATAAVARLNRAVQFKTVEAATFKERWRDLTHRVAAVGCLVPWLASVIGCSALPRVSVTASRDGRVDPFVAEMLCRLAHIPAKMFRGVAVGCNTILRARCFVVNLLLKLQAKGLTNMLRKVIAYRRHAAPDVVAGSEHGAQEASVVGLCHSWDESRQMLREPQRVPGARRPVQVVGRDILVQRSFVQAHCVRCGGAETFRRAETFLSPALELSSKTAGSLLDAFRKACAFPLDCVQSMANIGEELTALIVVLWCDAASSNRRLAKHLVASARAMGKQVLIDGSQVCLLHQLHRVRVQLVEAHASVSLAYCLAKLASAGTITGTVADHICDVIDRTCERRVGPPPADQLAKSTAVMDLLFDLWASHHVKVGRDGKTSESQLLKDCKELLRMDNGNLKGGEMIHHCWDTSTSAACCESLEEAKEKMKAAYLNFFVAHGLPKGALARWTHIGIVYVMLVAGFCFRDLFAQGLLGGLRANHTAAEKFASTADPNAIGANDGDRTRQHGARVTKVVTWLQRPNTKLHIAVLRLVVKMFDSLTCFLMGGARPGEPPRRPGTTARCEEPIRIQELVRSIASMMSGLLSLARTWQKESSKSKLITDAIGLSSTETLGEESVRFVRRLCVVFSTGVYRRLVVRLRSFPYLLAILLDNTISPERRRAVAAAFLRLRPCCVGPFGEKLQVLFPTPEALLSAAGLACIRVWLRCMLWSTYNCERENASLKRLCQSEGRGRNFSLVARERLMECVRAVHIERTECDPMHGGRNSPPETQATVGASSPLYPDMPAGSSSSTTWQEPSRELAVLSVVCLTGGEPDLADVPAAEPDLLDAAVALNPHAAGDQEVLAHAPPAPRGEEPPAKRPKAVSGGSPFQVYANCKLESAKQLALPSELTSRGSLKAPVLERIRDEIKAAWAALTDEERGIWGQEYRERLESRRQAARATAAANVARQAGPDQDKGSETALCPNSHWGAGSRHYAVHPELVRDALCAARRLPKDEDVFNNTEFVVPPLVSEDELLGEDEQLDGCLWRPRNTCDLHPLAGDIEIIRAKCSKLVKLMGTAAARGCDVLVLFEGSGIREPQPGVMKLRTFAFMSMMQIRPAFQVFTLCHPSERSDIYGADLPLPLKLCLSIVQSPFDVYGQTELECFSHQTRVCEYTNIDVMHVEITRIQVERAAEAEPAMDCILQAALSLQNSKQGRARGRGRSRSAAAGGRSRGSTSSGRGRFGRVPRSVADLDWAGEASDEDEDDVIEAEAGMDYEHNDAGLLEAASGLLIGFRESGPLEETPLEGDIELPPVDVTREEGDAAPNAVPVAGPPVCARNDAELAIVSVLDKVDTLLRDEGLLPGPEPGAQDVGAVSQGPGGGGLAASSSSSGGGAGYAGGAAASIAPPPPDILDGWVISEKGYVTDDCGRWVGTIGTWGKNISVKCRQHQCQMAKNKTRASARDFMIWLKKGLDIPAPVGDSMVEQNAHRALWFS